MSESAVTAPTAFRERLFVPWWGWPLPLGAAVLLAAEIHMGFPGVRSWLPYALLVPLAVLLLVRMGSTKVEVSGGELRVGEAHVPVELLGEVEVFDSKSKRKAMGPNLDPMAYVVHRGWVGPVVKVELRDPQDPTPYWLFSARSAERLAAVLRER
ncbi:DUF3093 domain-containing protein [Saccharothrix longispora]|uniref:DUF3093 family protein n=1 Tax=Saccharothrix longispora TaxID=33920 RepID=A0ABU1Q986_9PSEU|nr:DUF3093 domain-containing protein [Saccharothrix longispora]MDR6599004.1 hypothetical protein [Saccharothrix longispora]MDU0290183.1 DUF3093 domain-containing protein [Saccharothrix longispora]